jgi:hypothetical protein
MARFSDSLGVKEKIRDKIDWYGRACLDAERSFLVAFFPERFFGCELGDAQKKITPGLFKLDSPPAGLAWITQQDSIWISRILLNKQARIHPPVKVLRALNTTAEPSLDDSVTSPVST